jgi:hypothetical protein
MLARRLAALEASAREDQERRWAAAVEALRVTLDPEHARMIADWVSGPDAAARGDGHGHGRQRVCRRCVLDSDPPPLVRAVFLMLVDSLASGAPVAMPADVAAIYLADPDAYPANPCKGCGYPLPTRSRVLPDGNYRHIGAYDGACPVCGHDNTRVGEEAP